MTSADVRWFQSFQVESDGRSDEEVIWDDASAGVRAPRKPTRAEKISIILIGVAAIGFIVLMAVTLLVAIYISRQ